MSSVYFLEYSITTAFTQACANQIINLHPEKKDDFALHNAFTIFNFCYQIGVFISRSSLPILKINRVWIVTLLQATMFVLWMFNAFFLYIENIYVLFFLMIFVGLMGGASYVNVIYKIQKSEDLDRTEKELALTLLTVFDDIGIFCASLFSLIMSLTAFAKYADDTAALMQAASTAA